MWEDEPTRRWTRIALLAAGLAPVATPVFAQTYEGARLLGFGEAQRALTTQNDSIYVNPAGLALGSVYSVELGYGDDFLKSKRMLNASVVDSQAGPIAGGLAYTYSQMRPPDFSTPDERYKGHRVELSLATKVAEGAAIGVTTRYINFDHYLNGTKDNAGGVSELTMDVGLQWRVISGLSLGAVGYNLTNPKTTQAPISWGAGVGWEIGSLSIEGDVRYNAQKGRPLFSGGAGYVLGDVVPLRAGVSYDRHSGAISLSAGIGLILDRFAVDVGYRQELNKVAAYQGLDLPRVFLVALRGSFF
jgi:hypothetical protein